MKRAAIGVLALWLAMTAGQGGAADGTEDLRAVVLLWEEQEPGIAPYASRMLVTADFLRSDAGRDAADYLLFDRRSREIFSVSHAQQTVLVLAAEPIPDAAEPRSEIAVQVTEQPDAPRIAGRVVSHVRLSSDGEECLQATVVPGLLPEVVAALSELRGVLAARQYRDLAKTPEALRTPCFLANYVYAGDRHLRLGLPIQEAIAGGVHRVLLDYRTAQPVAASLFAIPAEYPRRRIP